MIREVEWADRAMGLPSEAVEGKSSSWQQEWPGRGPGEGVSS